MRNLQLASVIISSYNYGRFLSKAINSALNQIYDKTEVIVVDDGSTDNSREIIVSYGDRIIPVLKVNGGQASAFNAGFEMSLGEVIVFLDSDDMLLPTAVENAVNLFDAPNIAKVHWPLWIVDKSGSKSGNMARPDLPEGDLREIVIRNGPLNYTWPPTSGNAWARSFIERIFPMPEEIFKTWPDLYLGALAPLFGLVKKISEPQSLWRRHGANNLGRGTFAKKLEVGLWREEYCLDMARQYCEEMGIDVDLEIWKENSWWHQIYQVTQEIELLIPKKQQFILVDEGQLGNDCVSDRSIVSFLGRDGQYWGPPEDDRQAIKAVVQLRKEGASFIVFIFSTFWWLEHYKSLYCYLRSEFRCVMENNHLVAFDLRP